MRPVFVPARVPAGFAALLLGAVLAVGCGKEIGDDCQLNIDCDPNSGQRTCDLSSRDGYCTIAGCDYDTCPEESACVSFYIASFENRPCDPDAAASACGVDEVCTLKGQCVPRSSEVRYCMRKCSASDDCRTGYECRTEELMRVHGGQPVSPPGQGLGGDLQSFCATAGV